MHSQKLNYNYLVTDMRDPFRFRYDSKNMPAHWLYKLIEKPMVNQSYKILTTSPECATYYKNLYLNFPKQNIHVIYNGFSEKFHRSLPAPPVNKK